MVSPVFLPPPPPPAAPKTSLPMLYYGLIVVGTASIVLALYNLIVLRWCADRRTLPPERQNPFAEMGRIGNGNGNSNSNSNGNGTGVVLPASFRYKKEMAKGDGEGDSECAVCLSAFEEGEEIRRLPRCRHAFHAQCIDMWLFSHADCPLCRAPLAPARRCGRHASAEEEEGSREVLIVVNPVVAV